MNKDKSVRIASAVREGHCEMLRLLLEAFPDQVTAHTWFAGQTWLGYAASKGRLPVIETLVQYGADLNQGDSRDHATPICSAARQGHADIVAWLLTHGATLDTTTAVQNALFSAIIGRSVACVRLLLDAGIDPAVSYDTASMKTMDAAAFACMRNEEEIATEICRWQSGGDAGLAETLLIDARQRGEANYWERNTEPGFATLREVLGAGC